MLGEAAVEAAGLYGDQWMMPDEKHCWVPAACTDNTTNHTLARIHADLNMTGLRKLSTSSATWVFDHMD